MTTSEHMDPRGPSREPSTAHGIRILFLAPQPFYQDRGTPIRARRSLEALAAAGHRIDLLTYHEGADIAIPGMTIHRIPRLPGVNGIRPGFSLKKLLCDAVMLPKSLLLAAGLRPQVIHAVEESVFMAVVARRLFGVPYVYDMHSSVMEQLLDRFPRLGFAGPVLRRIERAVIRGSVGTIAVSPAVEELVREAAPDQLVQRVEDASQLPAAGAGPEWRLPEAIRTGPVVMYVGNLEAYQGVGLLLEAFRRAMDRVPDAQLVSIGGAEALIAQYRRLAADYGIQERTHFFAPRPVEELGRILAQADVLVSPRTRGTNTPMKIYSYLDSGVPVLATRLPTHTQVLDDDIAMLVAPEPGDMARGLVALLRDPARRATLAAAARTRAREVHTVEAFADKTQAFYQAVAASLHPAAAAPNRLRRAGVGGPTVPADELRWEQFCQQVKHQTRYLLATEGAYPPARLLQRLGDLVNEFRLVREIPAGQDFTRVRVHESPIPPEDFPELGPPPEHHAKFASRVSPAGVSVLYAARTFDTAVAETFDPGRGPAVATGVILRSTRPLRVLSLVDLPTGPHGVAVPEARQHQFRLLREFANDVSKPVVKDGREHVDYCPTQVVTEFFRYRFRSPEGWGLDGIRYPSSIDAGGENYVFFFGNDHFFPKHGSAKAPFTCRAHPEPHRPLAAV
ncbi:MAG: glycosyltransferase [Gemmatimonadales bacterium]